MKIELENTTKIEETNLKEIFSGRLKEARAWRDLTQEQLGERAGINASMIAHFEAGSRLPSLSNLQRIGKALVTSLDYLVGNSEYRGTASDDIIDNLRFANADEYALIRRITEYIVDLKTSRKGTGVKK